ncbi:MAG TPA: Uma2 family endonuclease [Tepidisphaeraceae bacterium]|nr:Uma2 family endonuclease [Tepidisphaeraceae bacterium]
MSAIALPQSAQPAISPLTPADLLAMPDAKGFELVDGKLVERHASVESSRVASRINRLLGNEAERTGHATVYANDLGYQCFPHRPNQIRKPDVSLIRKDRYNWASEADSGYMPIAADLAVEVISPNDLYYEVAAKVAEYLEAGFGAVWIVDPRLKTVRVESADGASVLFRENDEITGGSFLPGFRCRVAEFFRT